MIINLFLYSVCFAATSETFPPYEDAPSYTVYQDSPDETFYIAPSAASPAGSDSNNGTSGAPWLTLGHAADNMGPGDTLKFKTGTYPVNTLGTGNEFGPITYFDVSGTVSNYIAIVADDEAVIDIQGGELDYSFVIGGNYIIVDGLTSTTGCWVIHTGTNCIIQNCDFGVGGDCDQWGGGQGGDMNIIIRAGGDDTTIRNCYFEGSHHAVKPYPGTVDNLLIEYCRFYDMGNGPVASGVINGKSGTTVTDFEIRYCRFEDITGGTYSEAFRFGLANGIDIHHNVFDNVDTIFYQEVGEIQNLDIYNNVIYNGTTDLLFLRCQSDGSNTLGEIYNNALYGISDYYICGGSDYDNYPDYWDYNAYIAAVTTGDIPNHNSGANWLGNQVNQNPHAITRTGVAGNRFYTIETNSGFVDAGRSGGVIGGFVFSDTGTSTLGTGTSAIFGAGTSMKIQ